MASSVQLRSKQETIAAGPESWRRSPDLVARLQKGEAVVAAEAVTEWGALVTAYLYFPQAPACVWEPLSDCAAWPQLLPSLSESYRLHEPEPADRALLYQAAGFRFLCFHPKVETYLQVRERSPHCLTFRQVRGTLARFAAELSVSDWVGGTLVTYKVSARLPQPLPVLLLRQGIQGVLPYNLQALRRSLLQALA
ncbi:MAG: SRPBCC family protein [Cyanobacteria bacterium J06641_5]